MPAADTCRHNRSLWLSHYAQKQNRPALLIANRQQEKSSKFNAPSPGWNTFEYKVAVQMRKELMELLGYNR